MTDTINSDNTPLWLDLRAWALLFAASLTTMANATISPALTGLAVEFQGHAYADFLIRMLVPAPSLSIVLFAPFTGIMVDRYGRRQILLWGLGLFVVSGCAGYALVDLYMIFASRLLLGIAVAMIMTSQTALIGDYFHGGRRSSFNGWQVSARNFGGFIFITTAGWMAISSPRLPFLIYGLAAFLIPLALATLREPCVAMKNGDPVVNQKTASRDQTSRNWMTLLIGLSLLQAFTSMSFFLMPTQLPFFLEYQGFDGASMTGIMLGILTLLGGIAALFYSRLQRRLGHAKTLAIGYGLMAVGMALLWLDHSIPVIATGVGAIGIGFATVMPNFVALMLQLAPASHRGRAGGILTMSLFIGQIVSPMLSIPMVDRMGYNATFAVFATMLGIVSFACLIQWGRQR